MPERNVAEAEAPDRNIAMELVRTTEAAALAAGRWMGRGDRNRADQAAVDAMRLMLNSVRMDGVVVIGEGEKDEAPMLYNGERLGTGDPPQVDIAVDPIEGTRLLALGRPNAIAVVALSEQGTMYFPRHIVYMEKIAVGPEAVGFIDINAPVRDNLLRIAKAKSCDVDDLTVMILDRPRHEQLISEARESGARISLITDGDVAGAMNTVIEGTGIDVLMGVGGSPEAVIAACALKCLGGDMQCKLWPRNEQERQKALDEGLDLEQVLTIDDLVSGDNIFVAATGITHGDLLDGVQYTGDGAKTHSLSMRSRSGTVRHIKASHRWSKLMKVSHVPYNELID
jgi:fructose-1,6-bisphosphatase II